MQIRFSLGNTSFATDTYSGNINVANDIPPAQEISMQVSGSEDSLHVEKQVPERDPHADYEEADSSELVEVDERSRIKSLNDMGQTTVTETVGQWTKLRLPKDSFQRSGDSVDDWDDVQAVQLVVRTNAKGAAHHPNAALQRILADKLPGP